MHTVSHKLGYFHVQDYCSQQAALALEPPPGSRVLDCCAAPGSKSFVLAGLMEDRGEILACDAAAGRLSLVEAGAKRLGISCIATRAQDGTIYEPSLGLFDRVLCDVPCSGSVCCAASRRSSTGTKRLSAACPPYSIKFWKRPQTI